MSFLSGSAIWSNDSFLFLFVNSASASLGTTHVDSFVIFEGLDNFHVSLEIRNFTQASGLKWEFFALI